MDVSLSKRTLLISGIAAVPAAIYAASMGTGAMQACGPMDGYSVAAVDSAVKIGRIYLTTDLSTEERGELMRMSSGTDQAFAKHVVAQLKDLDVQSRRDFEHGNTVSCDGWVLSRTEAQLCAQVALRFKSSVSLSASLLQSATPSGIRHA